MKLFIFFGTRPEIIRLSEIIKRVKNVKSIKLILINSMQNFDVNLNDNFFLDLKLPTPNYKFKIVKSGYSNFLSNLFNETEIIIKKENPDAVLFLGDTNTCLASIIFKKYSIPIYHIEAGNRSFDENVPEEANRKTIDHIADINFPYSERARTNLLKENIHPQYIYKIGSPLYEVINNNLKKINSSSILKKLKLSKNNFFLISIHREENITNSNNLNKILKIIDEISRIYPSKKLVFTLHPRTKKIIQKKLLNKKIIFNVPFNFSEYMKLQINSLCVISDSGSITEESSILGFKAISIRNSFERHEGLESSTIINSGLDLDSFMKILIYVINLNRKFTVDDYTIKNSSHRVINTILSTYKVVKIWKNKIIKKIDY